MARTAATVRMRTGSTPDPVSALELLSGDAQTFRDSVWASRIHVHRADPPDLVSLLSLDDVDHLLTDVALRTPALRVVEGGSVLPASRFTRGGSIAGSPLTGLVDPRAVLDLYSGGATVVLQGLHRYWPPLTELVRSLELELGHPCQANAYLTPPASQGFARHADTHDVFVFQTHGRRSGHSSRRAGIATSSSSRASRSTCPRGPRTPRGVRPSRRCTSRSGSTASPGVTCSAGSPTVRSPIRASMRHSRLAISRTRICSLRSCPVGSRLSSRPSAESTL